MDTHSKALDSMFGDMDDMESKKMFGESPEDVSKGVSVTISVVPNGDSSDEMCEGGAVKMAGGGMVDEPSADTDLTLPPFLRKKRKI